MTPAQEYRLGVRVAETGMTTTTDEFLYALATASVRLNEPYTEITIELRDFGVLVVGGVSQSVLDSVRPMLPIGTRLERKLAP